MPELNKILRSSYRLYNTRFIKSIVTIILGVIVLFCGKVTLSRLFPEVMDGDSILPDTIAALLSFTTKEYALLYLAAMLLVIGLFLFISGVYALISAVCDKK